MARKSLFLGPRLKRLRRDLGLTQANMAEDLEISPSYVALIERNQRPVTAELLLKLASVYKVDVAAFAEDGGEELAKRLQGVLAQPMFSDIDLPALEAADIAASYPGFAEAFVRLNTAFSEEQIALAERRGGEAPSAAPDPVGEARAFLAARRNCFPAIDAQAAELARAIGDDGAGLSALTERLAQRHRLKVRYVAPAVILGALRFHDRHREQVLIADRLDHSGRRFQLALQIALLEGRDAVSEELRDGRFVAEDARSLARRALANHWAAALLMPYRRFARAARETRHDLEAMARIFACSFEQVAHRLTTLGQKGEEGVPFFFLRVDQAGNVSKRLDGAGFPFARAGGSCPLWNVHAAFRDPGQILPQWLELPDRQRFFSVARTVSAGGGGWNEPRAMRAVALACAAEHADRLVYADAIPGASPTPIGVACRLCHRPRCVARSAPPIGRELRRDENRETGVPFAFADD